MKTSVLIPAVAAGSSLVTAFSALMIGSRATFLAVVLIVAVAAFLAHKFGRTAETPAQPAEPVAPPLVIEAPAFINPTTGQPHNARQTYL
jgi:hypothetical protein